MGEGTGRGQRPRKQPRDLAGGLNRQLEAPTYRCKSIDTRGPTGTPMEQQLRCHVGKGTPREQNNDLQVRALGEDTWVREP